MAASRSLARQTVVAVDEPVVHGRLVEVDDRSQWAGAGLVEHDARLGEPPSCRSTPRPCTRCSRTPGFLHYPPDLLPIHTTMDAWSIAWRRGHFSRYLVNSALVSAAITAGQVTTSILAAYAFAFINFPGRRVFFGLFLACTMVPFEATLLPNYQTIVSLGWIDTYQALIVPFLASGLGTFLLRQTFLTVPQELVDAAALDGYGHPGILARVAVPIAGRRSPRSRCSPSSPPGGSTSGRSSSPTRPITEPCRSAYGCSPRTASVE